jgi:hypothetical protein
LRTPSNAQINIPTITPAAKIAAAVIIASIMIHHWDVVFLKKLLPNIPLVVGVAIADRDHPADLWNITIPNANALGIEILARFIRAHLLDGLLDVVFELAHVIPLLCSVIHFSRKNNSASSMDHPPMTVAVEASSPHFQLLTEKLPAPTAPLAPIDVDFFK